MTDLYKERRARFLNILKSNLVGGTLIAFSGGTDSFLLVRAAAEAVEDPSEIYACLISSDLNSSLNVEEKFEELKSFRVSYIRINEDLISKAGILFNPGNRCYLCKRTMFLRIKEEAEKLSVKTIMDGTNADDLKTLRPGLAALRELGVISPLAEAGMTKKDVRRMSEEYGLKSAFLPSDSCLATRIPYGCRLDPKTLERIRQGEFFLKNLGLRAVRLRTSGSLACVAILFEDLRVALESREALVSGLKTLGFSRISIDLEFLKS